MQAETGIPVSVVNRPGGGDGPFPGALEVLAAPADGSVVGSFVIGVPVIGPMLDIGIEDDSFEAIGIFLTYPFVLAASGDAPYSDMSELAEHAQQNDVVLGHFGAGLAPTQASLAAAKLMDFEFADDSAFDMLDCNSLNSGDADVINILANIGEERIGKLPDVATLSEQSGINDLELWNGLFVRKGTPQHVKEALSAFAEKSMMSDRAQQLMHETGARVYWQGAEDSEQRIKADRMKSAEIAGIISN